MKKLLIFLMLLPLFACGQFVYKIPYKYVQYPYFINGYLAVDSHGNLYVTTAGGGASPGNPSGLLTFTPSNGSNSVYLRNDGLHGIDSTIVASTANHPTLAQLQSKLNLKANIASPAFTGTVTIPNGSILGTPTSMTATNVTGLPLTSGVTGTLPIANGGTGTSSPALVPGTNITITGTWPNQTINASTSANSFVGVLSGGTGNGSTDDAAAIQASLTAATAGTVYLKQGSTYLISTGLSIPNGVQLNLNGSKIHCTASSGAIITLASDYSSVVNGEIYSDFDPSSTFTPPSGLLGIHITANHVTVDHVYLHNVQNYGILCADAGNYYDPTISWCNIVSTGYVGFYFNNASTNINGCTFIHNTVDRSALPAATVKQACVEIRGTSTSVNAYDVLVEDNKFVMSQSPTDVSGECIEVRHAPRARIIGNQFYYGTIGFSLVGQSDGSVISNNTTYGSIVGIETADNNQVSILNNTVDGLGIAGTSGILLDGGTGSMYCTVSGNTIRNCYVYGIHVYFNSNDNTFGNNTISQVQSGSSAVYIQGASRIQLTGNRLYGNTTANTAINLDASSSSGTNTSDNVFTNNTITDFTGQGVNIYCNRAVTIDGLIYTLNIVKNSGTVYNTNLSGGATMGSNVITTNNIP